MTMKAVLIAFTLSILSGCATATWGIARRPGDTPGVDLAVQSAGPPVQKVTYSSDYAGWRPLADDQVVIWANELTGYLVRIAQPCQALHAASQIRLTESHGWVRVGVNSVKFPGGGECLIVEIRDLNFQTAKR